MSRINSYRITLSSFGVIFLTILSQLLRVHARFILLPTLSESPPLLSWKDNDVFDVAAPLIPDDCSQGHLCDRVSNYPIELAVMVLTRLRFKNVTKFANDNLYEAEYDELDEVQELCRNTRDKIMVPLAAKDYKGEWQFILNMPRNPFQSFRVHECRNTEKVTCPSIAYVSDTKKYTADLNCEQIFTKRIMVYLDIGKKLVAADYFKVPSCCSCYLQPKS